MIAKFNKNQSLVINKNAIKKRANQIKDEKLNQS